MLGGRCVVRVIQDLVEVAADGQGVKEAAPVGASVRPPPQGRAPRTSDVLASVEQELLRLGARFKLVFKSAVARGFARELCG